MDHEKVSELENINKQDKENGFSENKDLFQDDAHAMAAGRDKTPLKRQALISFGTFMLTVGTGSTLGFSAILIPQLQHENVKHKYSTEMVSWVAAMAMLPMVFGNLTSGYLMERLGRRTSQVMLSAAYTTGWIVIGFAGNVYWILLGRFITGFCQGWLGPLGAVFIGEISTPGYRGLFLAGLSLAIAFGVFVSHLFGTFLHWSYSSLLCGLFPLSGGIILYFAPESPTWLAYQNRIDDCITSFQWYRGDSPEMKMELVKLIAEQRGRDHTISKLRTLKANIRKPEFYKPLTIMMMFFVMTQLSGVNVINAYTTDLMIGLIGSNVNTNEAMLSIDVLRCVSLSIACVLLKRNGRRPMALTSGILTSLSMITLALYLFIVDREHISPIITLGLMSTYIVVSNLGFVPLPWNMVGELFASETKGLGAGISVMMTSFAAFAMIKAAPRMFETIGHNGTYLFYGLSTLLGTVYLFFYLPETKGKTLLNIEEYFRYGKQGNTKYLKDDVCSPCV